MPLKHKIILTILLSAVLLSVRSGSCHAHSSPVLDSLTVKYEEAVRIYDSGDSEGAKVAFTHVMQGAFQHLNGHPEDNDWIQTLRLMCIRFFTIIDREREDIEASGKWISVGKRMASKYLSNVEDARYWNSVFITEQRINDKYLANKERSAAIKRRNLAITSTVACILAVLLIIVTYLFLTLRSTYRALVRKNEEMARNVLLCDSPPKIAEENGSLPDMIVQHMANTKAYLNPDLNLNDLCRDLCTNRTYLSNAFSEMGTNFNAFINKYRVAEAINVLSRDPACSLLEVWTACGFNSQSTFYSNFKNITGLTPAQFKKTKIEDSGS